MSLPRNTAPAAGEVATPAGGAARRRAVMVGNLLASSGLFFFAACSDTGITEPGARPAARAGEDAARSVSTYTWTNTQSSGTTSSWGGTTATSTTTTTAVSTSSGGDTARVTLTITPTTTATFQVNVHRVRIEAGSICDPATSGYGVGTWDRPCAVAQGTITVRAKSWTTREGRAMVAFSPDLRFVPGKVNTIWLLDRTAAANRTDPVTWCPPGLTVCVNEALADPSLVTSYTSDGFATRRIKHFSGFTSTFGVRGTAAW